jgi:hypothetical protein
VKPIGDIKSVLTSERHPAKVLKNDTKRAEVPANACEFGDRIYSIIKAVGVVVQRRHVGWLFAFPCPLQRVTP